MIVAKITPEQANEIKGQEFATDCIFNPVQDTQGNWIISLIELQYCNSKFISNVELIEFQIIDHQTEE